MIYFDRVEVVNILSRESGQLYIYSLSSMGCV